MTRSREHLRTAYEEACRMEIEALKPGNVHVFADGHRMSAGQFLESARVSAGPLADPVLPVGQRILGAVRATRDAVGTNTNLGIVLLSAPLIRAAEMPGSDLHANLATVLDGMNMDDTEAVFEAIALASPGGLGAAENDVRGKPTIGLLEAMREAVHRDMIARQYSTGFADIFGAGLAEYESAVARGESGMWPTIAVYMAFLASFPDSHIARKFGAEMAGEVLEEAAGVRSALLSCSDEAARVRLLLDFDRDLKARAVNPGTSADLTVACLLVHLLRRHLA